jgi:hypothetical protein
MSEGMPPKDKWCHRTGFQEKCLTLVAVDCKCDRWKTLSVKPEGGGTEIIRGDCIDDWAFYWGFSNERGLDQAAASADKVATKVEELQNEVSRGSSINTLMRAAEVNAGLLDKPRNLDVE